MEIKIELNTAAIARLDEAIVRALEKTGEVVLADIRNAAVMPYAQGNMQDDDTYVSDAREDNSGMVVDITTTTGGKARRLYYHPEYNFRKDRNANAGGEWTKAWQDGGDRADFVRETFAALLKEEGGT